MSCVALLVGATYDTLYLPLFAGTARADYSLRSLVIRDHIIISLQ